MKPGVQSEKQPTGVYHKPKPGSSGDKFWMKYEALSAKYPSSKTHGVTTTTEVKYLSTQADLRMRFTDVYDAIQLKREVDTCLSLGLEEIFTRILDRLKVKLDQLAQLYVMPFDIFQVVPICLDAWNRPNDPEKLNRLNQLRRILIPWRTKVRRYTFPPLPLVVTTPSEVKPVKVDLPPKKKPVVRRKTKPRGLTTKQTKAVELLGEYEGDYSRVAKALGVDPKTVRQHVNVAFKKLGMTPERFLNNPKFQHYRHDKRGQVAHSSNDDPDLDEDNDPHANDE